MEIGNRKSEIRNHPAGRAGFTLIEILLAIGILAIGITAVLFLFAMGARSHQRAMDRTRAALLADTVVNQIKADLADKLPDRYTEDKDGKIAPIRGAVHADFPEFRYSVRFDKLYSSTRDFYKIKLVIRWDTSTGAPGEPTDEAPLDPRSSETYETILRRKNF